MGPEMAKGKKLFGSRKMPLLFRFMQLEQVIVLREDPVTSEGAQQSFPFPHLRCCRTRTILSAL
jgi:hypothetical protein